jgi:hypothetical protein
LRDARAERPDFEHLLKNPQDFSFCADGFRKGRPIRGDLKMELGPIPGIRALPAVGARAVDVRPPAIFDIDASARPGDGGGQQGGRKAAGAEEDDELKMEAEDELGAEAFNDRQKGSIDTFA